MIYSPFLSSVERGSRSSSGNGKVAEIRRGTHGTLPKLGLQTAVQRPHATDRRGLVYSHRPSRFVLNPCFESEYSPLNIGLSAFGQALLQCLACLLPFLDHDLIDNVPYLTASSISVLPSELHQDIVNYLCFYILPFTISESLDL